MDPNFIAPEKPKKLLSFLNPIFNYVDEGRLFRQPFMILYIAIGFITFCVACWMVKKALEFTEAFGGAAYVWFALMIVVLLAAGIFSFLYWLRRAFDVKKYIPEGAKFQAIPAVSNLVITFGEWLGLTACFVCVCGGILGAIILPFSKYVDGSEMFIMCLGYAVGSIIVSYLWIVFFRLIGETIFAIGSIANDCQQINHNTRK